MVQLESELSPPVPLPPSATPVVHIKMEPNSLQAVTSNMSSQHNLKVDGIEGTTLDMDRHMTVHGRSTSHTHSQEPAQYTPLFPVKEENKPQNDSPVNVIEETNGQCNQNEIRTIGCTTKTWTQRDMDSALEALKSHNMSLTKASATYGIPSTTLWQRAHRLGIDTPKKEGSSKSWSEADLHNALHALRTGAISANKASKAYGIPSSTLYKIARREGIRLAAPFNAAPTSWRASDLDSALQSIRCGANTVQRAAAQFNIPTGTLYGRCKREGIELSRTNPTPWSEDAMGEALDAVRVGQMSINQAAIHFNLPYSSLYGRFKRIKGEDGSQQQATHSLVPQSQSSIMPHLIESIELDSTHTYHYAQYPHTHTPAQDVPS